MFSSQWRRYGWFNRAHRTLLLLFDVPILYTHASLFVEKSVLHIILASHYVTRGDGVAYRHFPSLLHTLSASGGCIRFIIPLLSRKTIFGIVQVLRKFRAMRVWLKIGCSIVLETCEITTKWKHVNRRIYFVVAEKCLRNALMQWLYFT